MACSPDRRAPGILLVAFLLLCAQASWAQSSDALKAYRSGKLDDAISLSLAALRAKPDDMDAVVVLGWCYLDRGKWDDAYRVAEKAQGAQSYDHRLVDIMGRAAFGLGRNAEALSLLQQYVTLVPEGTSVGDTYALMGEIYIRQGRFHHADIALTTAVSHSSADATLWSRLGYARECAKDYRHALEAYQEALSLNPSFPDARLGLGRVQDALGLR